MKVSVRSYLIAGVAIASTGVIAVTPVVLPVTPHGGWIAGAQPADDDSATSPGADQDDDQAANAAERTPGRAGDDDDDLDSTTGLQGAGVRASADESGGQASRGARSRISIVSADGQTSTGGRRITGGTPARLSLDSGADTQAGPATSDVQTFGVFRNRVTVAATGTIRPRTQALTTRSAASVSAAAQSALDSASAPSPGRSISPAVERAQAGQSSARARADTRADTAAELEPGEIRTAQPARSSSPFAGSD